MVFYYLWKIKHNETKTPKNVQGIWKKNTFFSSVTTTAVSRNTCKIWRNCFNFSNHWGIYPKETQKYCMMPPAEEYVLWIFQSKTTSSTTLLQSNSTWRRFHKVRCIWIRFHKIRCRTALKNRETYPQNDYQNISKWLPVEVHMLWKGFLVR